jgi:copper chaperone
MKNVILALTLITSSFLFANDKPDAPKKGDKEITFKVDGMDCSSCAKTVVKVYSDLKGVSDAKADAEKGTLKIQYDSKKVSEAELLAALKEKPKYTIKKAE